MATGELVLDVGTMLDGEAAVREGLIDNIGSLSNAIECLYEQMHQNKDKLNKDKESDTN
jgi:ClpP class serine protease